MLYKQRSRYGGLNLGGMLSALLLLNEFIQNNLGAIYHLVDWLKDRKENNSQDSGAGLAPERYQLKCQIFLLSL